MTPRFIRPSPPPGFVNTQYSSWSYAPEGRRVGSNDGVQSTKKIPSHLEQYGVQLKEGRVYSPNPNISRTGHGGTSLSHSRLLDDDYETFAKSHSHSPLTYDSTPPLLPSLFPHPGDSTPLPSQSPVTECEDPLLPFTISQFDQLMNNQDRTPRFGTGQQYGRTVEPPISDPGAPTRFMKVSNVSQDMSIWVARDAFKRYGDLKGIFTTFLGSDGIIFLEFFDIRHSMDACRRLHLNEIFQTTSIEVQFCPKSALSLVSYDILEYDNEGILTVSVHAPRMRESELLRLLSSFGDVLSFQIEGSGWPPKVMVEYYDIRKAATAKSALESLHTQRQIHCQVEFYQQDRTNGQKTLSFRSDSSTLLVGRISTGLDDITGQCSLPTKESSESSSSTRRTSRVWASPSLHDIPTKSEPNDAPHRLAVTYGETETVTGEKPEAVLVITQDAHVKKEDAPQPRSLPQNEIMTDKRTTYMIRNIPNKYTQEMLLECINETHFGKFDFLYLRMDFKNKCNVGYAFINFISIEVVESFVVAHVGKKWSRFNSDKICSLSFATIQGRQALIDKFRNSSVMDEEPSYRPKIFYTSGPNAGLEEPFPEPTVHTKDGSGQGSIRHRLSGNRQNQT
ncbi:hypothetical protein BGZ83_001715 [Gryganskiella cystojenkinii]|nr:hypothetical protein BGZ83_001715 [Gryganskiella cystojenkinii]